MNKKPNYYDNDSTFETNDKKHTFESAADLERKRKERQQNKMPSVAWADTSNTNVRNYSGSKYTQGFGNENRTYRYSGSNSNNYGSSSNYSSNYSYTSKKSKEKSIVAHNFSLIDLLAHYMCERDLEC